MKNLNTKRFAPVGLVVSILALVSAIGYYVVMQEWNLPLQISLGMVVVGLALYALLDPEQVRRLLTGRQAKFGSNALVITAAFTGILVITNYLAYQNTSRWDLTEDQQNTLALETLDTLEKLPQPVLARAFFTNRLSSDQARVILNLYATYGQGKFRFEFIDPEADPVAARQANVTRDGALVLTMEDRLEQITLINEQSITGALIRLINPEKKNIAFLTGHGEFSWETSGGQSYTQLKLDLEAKNYGVSTLNLLATSAIPEDVDLIVIAGPTKPLVQGEVDLLADFVANGGGLALLLEPSLLTDFQDEDDLLVEYLASTWGIVANPDIVIDSVGQQLLGNAFIAVGTTYGNHPATTPLAGVATFFLHARSFSLEQTTPGISVVNLVSTAQQSWSERNLDAILEGIEPVFEEGTDQAGPVVLAVAAEDFNSNARLVVFGDADFTSDDFLNAYGNRDLFMNTIDWSIRQEDLISLTPKQATTRSLTLQPTAYTKGLIVLFSVLLLPGSTLVAGIVVMVLRRRRG